MTYDGSTIKLYLNVNKLGDVVDKAYKLFRKI